LNYSTRFRDTTAAACNLQLHNAAPLQIAKDRSGSLPKNQRFPAEMAALAGTALALSET
jgi:hypothetical protein